MSSQEQTQTSLRARLEELVGFRGDTKDDRELKEVLGTFSEERMAEILGSIDQIPKSETAQYMLTVFDDIDEYPQPTDGVISRGELLQFLSRLNSTRNQAMLLTVWLSFNDIKNSVAGDSQDGVFDYQFSRRDVQAWAGLN